jgi:hypothetical protein
VRERRPHVGGVPLLPRAGVQRGERSVGRQETACQERGQGLGLTGGRAR